MRCDATGLVGKKKSWPVSVRTKGRSSLEARCGPCAAQAIKWRMTVQEAAEEAQRRAPLARLQKRRRWDVDCLA